MYVLCIVEPSEMLRQFCLLFQIGLLGFWNTEMDSVGDQEGENIFGNDRKASSQTKVLNLSVIWEIIA